MKITGVTTYVLRTSVDKPFTSARGWWYKTKNAMLVKVSTDEGIEGWGEAYGPAEVTKTVVDTLLAPSISGHNPFDTDVLWEKMYQRVEDYDPQGFGVAAISAVDIALWDIMGKALNRPVYALLGGAHRKTFRAYATGLYFSAEEGDFNTPAVEEALAYQEQGFTGVKMKIALPPKEELKRVQQVRQALSDDVELMVDANHGYNLTNALFLGKAFEEMGLAWFEEPVSPHDLNAYADLRNKLQIPLAGGENAFTRYAFKDIIEKRAMDIIQPDVCCAGGITETKKIGQIAEAFGISVIPHVWGSAVGLHAALHVMAALPPAPHSWRPVPMWMEYEQTENPFRDHLVQNPVEHDGGIVRVPEGPGLGFSIDEKVIDRYRIS
ncbi:mandelate racemase/muconate lactonizing enzyme family protein [Alicyclobacillus tolerans]|uniref:mandelate racemase/muconate lactonizing enzyme family protein n=1 Tax=Alicyclobacillus tolerans TaxID=90970 RepID=UPI001F37D2B8|nr:mandelate racemase/muconate lactonizing enzyme family protein [Alicyclobacillus tolerans]MCF8565575.1 mandelate racemase/muconate lactonizing enzyme family protein [Alicyclobacillus tolerans]